MYFNLQTNAEKFPKEIFQVIKKMKKIIVISAPSGGGKSVVSKFILEKFPNISFSISSTTRKIREGEKDGNHYYFLTQTDFENKIKNNEFIEYEEIFGNYYGTLKSEVDKIWTENKILLFDIDVKGAYSIKKNYPNETLLIFLKPPSIEILAERLKNRKTENEEQIKNRISRAELEIEMSKNFDFIVTNSLLDETLNTVQKIINENIFNE